MTDSLYIGSQLLKIGQGFCGTVWADDRDADSVATSLALKRADGGPGRSISHEYRMHNHILQSLSQALRMNEGFKNTNAERFQLNIPSSVAFLEPNSKEWPSLLSRLPRDFSACEAIVSERIMPMPLKIREMLGQRYWCVDNAATIARDKTNESCLIRPYLGRRTVKNNQEARQRPSKLQLFSLRNFPLHINQVEDLDLPATSYAETMADALAFLHWVAKVDACDVEFVLSRRRSSGDHQDSPKSAPSIGVKSFFSDAFGRHALWMLDFDCCKDLEMSEAGMLRAATCFWRNDPFYPKPGATHEQDQKLWEAFEGRFLETSDAFLKGESDELRQLPSLLMRKINEHAARGVGHLWAEVS